MDELARKLFEIRDVEDIPDDERDKLEHFAADLNNQGVKLVSEYFGIPMPKQDDAASMTHFTEHINTLICAGLAAIAGGWIADGQSNKEQVMRMLSDVFAEVFVKGTMVGIALRHAHMAPRVDFSNWRVADEPDSQ